MAGVIAVMDRRAARVSRILFMGEVGAGCGKWGLCSKWVT
jgi:hypothetical protein